MRAREGGREEGDWEGEEQLLRRVGAGQVGMLKGCAGQAWGNVH